MSFGIRYVQLHAPRALPQYIYDRLRGSVIAAACKECGAKQEEIVLHGRGGEVIPGI